MKICPRSANNVVLQCGIKKLHGLSDRHDGEKCVMSPVWRSISKCAYKVCAQTIVKTCSCPAHNFALHGGISNFYGIHDYHDKMMCCACKNHVSSPVRLTKGTRQGHWWRIFQFPGLFGGMRNTNLDHLPCMGLAVMLGIRQGPFSQTFAALCSKNRAFEWF